MRHMLVFALEAKLRERERERELVPPVPELF